MVHLAMRRRRVVVGSAGVNCSNNRSGEDVRFGRRGRGLVQFYIFFLAEGVWDSNASPTDARARSNRGCYGGGGYWLGLGEVKEAGRAGLKNSTNIVEYR
jgi:hypothetical protein